jgi:hypothetical protein
MVNRTIDTIMRARLPIVVFVALAAFSLAYYVGRAERDGVGYQPEQPIDYSHKLHAGEMQIDCEYCHTEARTSRRATVPDAATCMNCHSMARKDAEDIKFLKAKFDKGEPIGWKRVHRVPDYAYFSHVSHVAKGLECESCHGVMEAVTVGRQAHSFAMGKCLDCHRNAEEKLPYLRNPKNGPDHCWACHR